MSYEDKTPGNTPLVVVEWLDIADSEDVVRRWSAGWLVATTFISEGVPCMKLYGTWDEDGWSDPSTFKQADVVYVDYLGTD